jgi:hypothetical protein
MLTLPWLAQGALVALRELHPQRRAVFLLYEQVYHTGILLSRVRQQFERHALICIFHTTPVIFRQLFSFVSCDSLVWSARSISLTRSRSGEHCFLFCRAHLRCVQIDAN